MNSRRSCGNERPARKGIRRSAISAASGMLGSSQHIGVSDMESFLSVATVGGSIFSTIATFYFWLVKARGERTNLKPYAVDREFFLGNGTAETRQVGFKAGIVVANYSTLPNAL